MKSSTRKKESFKNILNRISKEDFITFYRCHSHEETRLHFNLSGWSMDRLVNYFDAHKTVEESTAQLKRTKLERYGDENYVNTEKSKQTRIERYGNANYNNPEKGKQTRIENSGSVKKSYELGAMTRMHHLHQKYGEDLSDYFGDVTRRGWQTRDRTHGSRNAAINSMFQHAAETVGVDNTDEYFDWWTAQRMNTERVRYNVENHFQNIEKYNKTVIRRWGSLEAMRECAWNHCKQTMLERYGVPISFQLEHIKYAYSAHSKVNISFGIMLQNSDITYEEEFPLDIKSFDFKIGNTLVEINPTATHNNTICVFNGQPSTMSTDYHLKKTQLAIENGFQCVHVWDWDDWSKIINMFTLKQSIGARKCTVVDLSNQIKTVNDFLDRYHLQNHCRGVTAAYGLFYNDELVEVMTFGKPRYTKKYQYELLRLCTHPRYRISGGASRLFATFIRDHQPESIISYCDNSKFDGAVYSKLGMKLVDYGSPTKHWSYLKDSAKFHVTDNLLRQRGFDALFGNIFGIYGKGTNNEELMLKHGFVVVYDCGQSVYSWINTNKF